MDRFFAFSGGLRLGRLLQDLNKCSINIEVVLYAMLQILLDWRLYLTNNGVSILRLALHGPCLRIKVIKAIVSQRFNSLRRKFQSDIIYSGRSYVLPFFLASVDDWCLYS